MKSKWFKFDEKDKARFDSERRAITLKEAWEKTFEKWELILGGFWTNDDMATCGLCNYFFENRCRECPVAEMAGDIDCLKTPYYTSGKDRNDEEYLWLLLVREATKTNVNPK